VLSWAPLWGTSAIDDVLWRAIMREKISVRVYQPMFSTFYIPYAFQIHGRYKNVYAYTSDNNKSQIADTAFSS
jgi:hypothetical protein